MEKMLKTGQQVLIREARVSDAQALLDFFHKVNQESKNLLRENDEFKMTVEDEEKFIQSAIGSKNNCHLLLFLEDELICSAGFHGSGLKRIKHRVSLGISVLKEHNNKGVGHAMMEALIAFAKEYGKKKMELEVRSDNYGAIHLYKKFGFEIEGVKKQGFFVDGKFVDLVEMGLMIDE